LTKKFQHSQGIAGLSEKRNFETQVIDTDCKDKDLLALIQYIAAEDKAEKILENQKVIKTPIVRNGKQATVGYQPEVWKNWK
jgi:arsenate reductase-like glutaredoxin family protein